MAQFKMQWLKKWVFSWRGFLLLLFILFFLLPTLQNWRLEAAREDALDDLQRKRQSRVIALIHRQESVNVLGIPVMRYIDVDDSEEILRAIRMTDKKVPLDIILHTPGGLVLAASQIAKAIKRHPAKTTVFVPHYAMSGGTLIALAAEEIVMDPNAVLGPIDPQLGDVPAASILKVLEKKSIDSVNDMTLILADQSEKAIAQVIALAENLLQGKMPPQKAKEVARRLATGTWTHDFPISADAASKIISLPVNTEMPVEVYGLIALYPQGQQGRPSVSYLPGPRYKGEESSSSKEGLHYQ